MRHEDLLDYHFKLHFFLHKINELPSPSIHTYLDDKAEVFAMVFTFF